MSGEPNMSAGEEAAQQLISLAEAADLSGMSQSHLRLLVRQGTIWGTKIGRNWVTTEVAVKEYLATERRPGPKTSEEDNPRE
jgi:excisionase family DNA binding protein